MSWGVKSFDEIGYISRGRSRHRPRNAEYLFGGDYPFVQTGDVKAANFRILEYSQTYNEEGLAQSKLWPKDTLCITIAANIAETALLGFEGCFPDSIIGFIPYDGKADVRFVKYFFDVWKERMQKVSAGAAQDNLSLEKLLEFKIPTPDISIQCKIASILSAYDDLIENNLKRIKLLEEKAFVSYKLLVNSEKLIEGKVGDLADVKSGYAFKSRDWSDEGFPVIKIKNIGNNDIDLTDCSFIPESIAEAASKFKLNAGDLLIAMTGATVGKIGMMPRIETSFYLNQRVGIFKPKVENAELFLFCFFNEPTAKDAVESLASGAAQPNISGGQIESIKLFYTKSETVTDFGNSIKSHFELIWNLKQQNTKLREARDILLPRLINGQIEV
ncbi:MAG: restriction endonuclease subunit S [Bacteroidales bacterium]|jgi:type I restriction enzyme S subunit